MTPSLTELPVRNYMHRPTPTIPAYETLAVAQRRMEITDTSCLGVVDARGELIGVISRSDLVRIGRRAGTRHLVDLPPRAVEQVMTPGVVRVASGEPLLRACNLMLARQVHQLFVEDGGAVIGMLGVPDLMLALCTLGVDTPLERLMSRALFTIDVDEPATLATRLLAEAHISGIIVTEHGAAVGVLSQADAMAHRDAPAGVPARDVMDTAMLCLPARTPLRDAAARALAAGVQRVIACDHRDAVGVLSGLDFARAVTSAARPTRSRQAHAPRR